MAAGDLGSDARVRLFGPPFSLYLFPFFTKKNAYITVPVQSVVSFFSSHRGRDYVYVRESRTDSDRVYNPSKILISNGYNGREMGKKDAVLSPV